jgi:putative ubiquitin-RnfH superfamily antitoxin RatB of RatAB toxin-antitoxin module
LNNQRKKVMKKQQLHPRFPKTLASYQHLEGGIYGTLSLVALDPGTLEVRLGSDFVRVNADVASQLAEACAHFAGSPVEMFIETEAVEEIDEDDDVVEVEQPRLARPKRSSRRRAGV